MSVPSETEDAAILRALHLPVSDDEISSIQVLRPQTAEELLSLGRPAVQACLTYLASYHRDSAAELDARLDEYGTTYARVVQRLTEWRDAAAEAPMMPIDRTRDYFRPLSHVMVYDWEQQRWQRQRVRMEGSYHIIIGYTDPPVITASFQVDVVSVPELEELSGMSRDFVDKWTRATFLFLRTAQQRAQLVDSIMTYQAN